MIDVNHYMAWLRDISSESGFVYLPGDEKAFEILLRAMVAGPVMKLPVYFSSKQGINGRHVRVAIGVALSTHLNFAYPEASPSEIDNVIKVIQSARRFVTELRALMEDFYEQNRKASSVRADEGPGGQSGA